MKRRPRACKRKGIVVMAIARKKKAANPFDSLVDELTNFDWAGYMEAVAPVVLGECNEQKSRPPEDVRFGTHGSMSVNYTKGVWRNYESGEKGGVKDLIRIYKGIEKTEDIIAFAKECMNGNAAPDEEATSEEKEPQKASNGKDQQQTELEATYTYRDKDNQTAFQVCRLLRKNADGSYAVSKDGKRLKEIRQRRPSGESDGSWMWSVKAGEFMRSGPGKDWVPFKADKYEKYPSTKEYRNSRRVGASGALQVARAS